jgi:DNA-directed RNA polymerase specialized sigma24 family protein
LLRLLGDVIERHCWVCHSYCLMPNHHHLMIETPEPNLSRGMRQLNGVYAQTFNKLHGRTGHLFGGRFKSILVEREPHLLNLCGYIARNPLRWRPPLAPLEEYRWSSYLALAGRTPAPPWLTTVWVLRQFARRRRDAERLYADFVHEHVDDDPWRELKGDLYLGSDAFAHAHSINDDLEHEIPLAHKQPARRTLTEIFAAEGERAILVAHLDHGYRLHEIAALCGVHYSTVSRRLKHLLTFNA